MIRRMRFFRNFALADMLNTFQADCGMVEEKKRVELTKNKRRTTGRLNKTIRLYAIIATLMSCVFVSWADEKQIDIHPLQAGGALPSNLIHQVYEDNEGIIWLATFRGLVRYTRGTLRIFRSNLYTPELLPSNNVICVQEDLKQRLWIGTENGLCRLDKKTGRMVQMEIDTIQYRRVNELLTTRDGNVYAGMIRGLMHFDEASGMMESVGLTDVNIQSLAETPDGKILIGTWGKGLFLYSTTKGFKPLALPTAIASQTILAIFYDKDKRLWMGTLEEGLCQMAIDENDKLQIVAQYVGKDIPSNCVYCIIESAGQLCAGTRKGLFVEGSPTLLQDEEVMGVCTDQTGYLWVATKGMGVFTTAQQNHKPEAAITPSFQRLTDKDGNQWEVQNYGVAYKPSASEQTVLLLPELRPYRLSQTQDGRVLIPVHDAGVYVAYKGKIEKHYSRKTGDMFIPHDLVHHAVEDSQGNLWVATRLGLGVRFHDGCECIPSERPGTPDYVSDEMFFLAEDRQGFLWAATSEGMIRCDSTYHRYSVEDGNFPIGAPLDFCQDKSGRRWVGTDGMGLCLYDSIQNCFLSVHECLQLPGDIVTGLKADEDGSLSVDVGTEIIRLTNDELLSLHRNSQPDTSVNRRWLWLALGVLLCGGIYILYKKRQHRQSGAVDIAPQPKSISPRLPDMVKPATDPNQQFIDKATSIVLTHLSDSDFDVPQLVNELGTSRTTLHRRMKELTGDTTTAFIRSIRLQAATQILSTSPGMRVSDLAYQVGFNDPKYFSRCFKDVYGVLPGDYPVEKYISERVKDVSNSLLEQDSTKSEQS